jgi:hypothetical protein
VELEELRGIAHDPKAGAGVLPCAEGLERIVKRRGLLLIGKSRDPRCRELI